MSKMFRALKTPNYRLWTSGALVSNIGTWMQRVAQDWLVLTVLTRHDGTAAGITTGLQFLPILFLGAYAGVVADRMSKRKLLLVTQSLMGLFALSPRPAGAHRDRRAVARLPAGTGPGRGQRLRRTGPPGVCLRTCPSRGPAQRRGPEQRLLQPGTPGRTRRCGPGHCLARNGSGLPDQRRKLRRSDLLPEPAASPSSSSPQPGRRAKRGRSARALPTCSRARTCCWSSRWPSWSPPSG